MSEPRREVSAALTVTVTVEAPPDAPDMEAGYPARTGRVFRPDVARMVFAAADADGGRVTYADLTLRTLTISGPLLRKNGEPSLNRHSEPFYHHTALAPEWAQELVRQALADLTGGEST